VNLTKFAISVQLGTNMNLLDFEVKRSKVKVTVRSNALFRRMISSSFFVSSHLPFLRWIQSSATYDFVNNVLDMSAHRLTVHLTTREGLYCDL